MREAIQSETMRLVFALGLGWLFAAAAQQPTPPTATPAAPSPAEQPAVEQPAERPLLRNTGKPMAVEYQCTEEDIQSAGLSCSAEEPCPVYLELSSVEAVGNRIFLAGNIHSASTTLYSMLLASDDAGKTWREPYERMRAAGLDHIQFIDFENGWVSGEVLSPLPRDPFLLITSDGGKAWRAEQIFAESAFGAIMQFRFISRKDGSMLIDRGQPGEGGRYALYETPNGGDTWMLREVNQKPIKLKYAGGSGNTDWRIRADAATKSYRIEHHAGERWHGIAGFSVSIGACRPPEIPIAPAAPVASPPGQ
jgi:hypothetical protein